LTGFVGEGVRSKKEPEAVYLSTSYVPEVGFLPISDLLLLQEVVVKLHSGSIAV
jgi:hypothetical protein